MQENEPTLANTARPKKGSQKGSQKGGTGVIKTVVLPNEDLNRLAVDRQQLFQVL